MSETGIPAGFVKLDVKVYCDGQQIVLTGEPPNEGLDPTCEIHHCDSMGCRWEHVLFYCNITEDQATEVGYVAPILEQPTAIDGQPTSEARRKAMERQTEAGNHVITHERGEG